MTSKKSLELLKRRNDEVVNINNNRVATCKPFIKTETLCSS